MTAALVVPLLVTALLVAVRAYLRVMALDSSVAVAVGRHRLSRTHPGWETAPEDLAALLRIRRARR